MNTNTKANDPGTGWALYNHSPESDWQEVCNLFGIKRTPKPVPLMDKIINEHTDIRLTNEEFLDLWENSRVDLCYDCKQLNRLCACGRITR